MSGASFLCGARGHSSSWSQGALVRRARGRSAIQQASTRFDLFPSIAWRPRPTVRPGPGQKTHSSSSADLCFPVRTGPGLPAHPLSLRPSATLRRPQSGPPAQEVLSARLSAGQPPDPPPPPPRLLLLLLSPSLLPPHTQPVGAALGGGLAGAGRGGPGRGQGAAGQ